MLHRMVCLLFEMLRVPPAAPLQWQPSHCASLLNQMRDTLKRKCVYMIYAQTNDRRRSLLLTRMQRGAVRHRQSPWRAAGFSRRQQQDHCLETVRKDPTYHSFALM